jgi:hypothetical protein
MKLEFNTANIYEHADALQAEKRLKIDPIDDSRIALAIGMSLQRKRP